MHLKMKISMEGPAISVGFGAELPFDENFPFSADEVHRFRAGDIAELVGTDDEIAAWLKANPDPCSIEPPSADDASDAATAAPAEPAPKPAAAKAAAKKG